MEQIYKLLSTLTQYYIYTVYTCFTSWNSWNNSALVSKISLYSILNYSRIPTGKADDFSEVFNKVCGVVESCTGRCVYTVECGRLEFSLVKTGLTEPGWGGGRECYPPRFLQITVVQSVKTDFCHITNCPPYLQTFLRPCIRNVQQLNPVSPVEFDGKVTNQTTSWSP